MSGAICVTVRKAPAAFDGICWTVKVRGEAGKYRFLTHRRAMRFADAVAHGRPYRDDGKL